jgi:hypothetical protein
MPERDVALMPDKRDRSSMAKLIEAKVTLWQQHSGSKLPGYRKPKQVGLSTATA